MVAAMAHGIQSGLDQEEQIRLAMAMGAASVMEDGTQAPDPETVRERLAVYHRETEPLKAFYAERGLLRTVENQPTVEENTRELLKALGREGV